MRTIQTLVPAYTPSAGITEAIAATPADSPTPFEIPASARLRRLPRPVPAAGAAPVILGEVGGTRRLPVA